MLKRELRRPGRVACAPATTMPGGRRAVGTYVMAWLKLCDALWREELEDPFFRRAVELAEAVQPAPGPDAHWLKREAWRDCIRSWWFSVRENYTEPSEIPDDWLIEQREWESERALSLNPQKARASYFQRRAATWERAEALIETGAFWPLDLDAPHLVRAQFDTLREWVPAAPPE